MPPAKAISSEQLKTLWPEVWVLVKPRKGILLAGAALMVVNRVCGLALPVSTKFLITNVMGHGQTRFLAPIVLAVVGATVIQGITSFSLTQLLSKSGQRLIYEMRVRIQEHIGRLSVSFYDSNKTGTLVSRIMSDVGRRSQPHWYRTGGIGRRPVNSPDLHGDPVSHKRHDDFFGAGDRCCLRVDSAARF